MRGPDQAGQVAFVQPSHSLIAEQVHQPITEPAVPHVARNRRGVGEAEPCLHHPDGVGQGQRDDSCM